jgi:hypothetical protein
MRGNKRWVGTSAPTRAFVVIDTSDGRYGGVFAGAPCRRYRGNSNQANGTRRGLRSSIPYMPQFLPPRLGERRRARRHQPGAVSAPTSGERGLKQCCTANPRGRRAALRGEPGEDDPAVCPTAAIGPGLVPKGLSDPGATDKLS